ncbi:tetratricopeptide repeat protein [Patescibacteria group bacterium]|nr:tetratricopeptide repeat protein [Patescibacteria group bacterium]
MKLERFQGYILSLLVLLLPIFWLPLFFEAWEFPKLGLLFLLSLAGLGLTLAKEISAKTLRVFWPFDALVTGFVLIFCFSALFSNDRLVSLFGFYGRFSDGLIALISLALAYFSISRYSQNKKLLKLLLISALLACAPVFWSLNLAAPSFEALAMFLVPLVFVSLGQDKKIFRFFSFVFLAFILLIDYTPSWLVLVFVSGAYLIFLLVKSLQKQDKFLSLSLVLIFILALMGLVLLMPNLLNLAKEVTLDHQFSFQLAKQSLSSKPILGSGPGTFSYAFSKFRPIQFNQSSFWQLRFDRPVSYLVELAVSCGLLGLIGFLLIVGFGLKAAFSKPLFFSFLAGFLVLTVYYQNIVLGFVFWLMLSLIATDNSVVKEVSLERILKSRNLNLVFLGFVSLLTVTVVLMTFKIYSGDYFYNRGFQSQTSSVKVSWLEKAVSVNPFFAQYQVMLSRALLNQAIAESNTLDIFQLVTRSVQAANASTKTAPAWVASWETLAGTYQEILGLVTGAENWSITALNKAAELEPSNPLLYFKLGKVYFSQNNFDQAKDNFTLVQLLKPDLIEPKIFLSLIVEKQIGSEAALNSFSHLQNIYPLNPDITFQLGRIYFNQGQTNEAIVSFQQALKLNPQHLDSLYSLALAFEKQGNKAEAMVQIKKALELAPQNQILLKKLGDLNKD